MKATEQPPVREPERRNADKKLDAHVRGDNLRWKLLVGAVVGVCVIAAVLSVALLIILGQVRSTALRSERANCVLVATLESSADREAHQAKIAQDAVKNSRNPAEAETRRASYRTHLKSEKGLNKLAMKLRDAGIDCPPRQ